MLRPRRILLTGFSLLLLAGCPPPANGEADGGDAGSGACVVPDGEHAQLLNAPTNATVVHKTPAHPPLDGGLP